MTYLLDANVLIGAKRLYYGFDFCPGFWEWIALKNDSCIIFSIEKVYDEISASKDDLSEWATQKGTKFFLRPDDELLPAFKTVSTWLYSQEYKQSAINHFLQGADFYLIAHALAKNYTVVTYEVPSGSKKRIKIPDVCIGLQVKCLMVHQMLRQEKACFVLKTNKKKTQ